MNNINRKSRLPLSQLLQGIKATHESQSQLKESSAKAVEKIHEKFQHLRSLLQQREQQLTDRVMKIAKEKEAVFETQRRIINQLTISRRSGDFKTKEVLKEITNECEPLETPDIGVEFEDDNKVCGLLNNLGDIKSQSPICAGLCTLTGSLIGSTEIELGRTAVFTVVLKDHTGATISGGNNLKKIQVKIRGPNGHLESTIYDYQDGHYRVSFLCNTSAALYITVKVQGSLGMHHVHGSPFIINVVAPVSVYRSFNLISNPAHVLSTFRVPDRMTSMKVTEDGHILVGTNAQTVKCYHQDGSLAWTLNASNFGNGFPDIRDIEQMPDGELAVLFTNSTKFYRPDGKVVNEKNHLNAFRMTLCNGNIFLLGSGVVWREFRMDYLPVHSVTAFAKIPGNDTNYYITNGNYIQELNMTTPVRKFGGTGSKKGKLKDPQSIAVSRDGHVIVADRGNHRVQIFSKLGSTVHHFFVNEFGQQEFNPDRVAVDHEGRVIVADFVAQRIYVI